MKIENKSLFPSFNDIQSSVGKLSSLASIVETATEELKDKKKKFTDEEISLRIACNQLFLKQATTTMRGLVADRAVRDYIKKTKKLTIDHGNYLARAIEQMGFSNRPEIFIRIADENQAEKSLPLFREKQPSNYNSVQSRHLALVLTLNKKEVVWPSAKIVYCTKIHCLETGSIEWDYTDTKPDFIDWSIVTALLYLQTQKTAALLLVREFGQLTE